MNDQTYHYEFDDIEQAKMARDIIKEVIYQHEKVLKQRYYYKNLEIFYDLLCKDLPEEKYYE